MAGKQNKTLIVGVVVAVVVVIAVIVGVVLAKGNGEDAVGGDESAGQIEEPTNEMDFSNIDVSVAYGDYDTMFAQSKAIQNGEMLGKVIKIEGIVSHPMNNYSIGQEDEDGSFVGTVFEIMGSSDEEDYPKDGDRVIITGKIVEKSPMNFVIQTHPQYVDILETTELIDEEGVESDEMELLEIEE